MPGPRSALSPTSAPPSRRLSEAGARWLCIAARRDLDLEVQLLPFHRPLAPKNSLSGRAHAARQARHQLLSLSALRAHLQTYLERPPEDHLTATELQRRWALYQTDADICALIVHWATAALPEHMPVDLDMDLSLQDPADDAQGHSGDRRRQALLGAAEHAYTRLQSVLVTLQELDKTAHPQPRLCQLSAATCAIATFISRLKLAKEVDSTLPSPGEKNDGQHSP